jgi:hypothetical protein
MHILHTANMHKIKNKYINVIKAGCLVVVFEKCTYIREMKYEMVLYIYTHMYYTTINW